MSQPIKAALLDFDGTLVTKDILDILCTEIGKGAESAALNAAFHRGELPGLTGLIARINFLTGLTKTKIFEILSRNSYLMLGAEELMTFFHDHDILTILASGNIIPVLEYYQQLLGIDYLVGPQPQMSGETILGIDATAFSSSAYKIDGIKPILAKFQIQESEIVALGDSPSDKGMLSLSGFAIAVNPKGDLAEVADVVIGEDLRQAVRLLEKLT